MTLMILKRNDSMKMLLSICMLLLLSLSMACGSGDEEVVDTGIDVEWSYSGAGAPANWASISADYATCGEGQMQSPINITGYSEGDAPPLSFSFRKDAQEIYNEGKQVVVRYARGNRLGLSERTYQLVSAHLHAPSEHQIDGELFAAELHLVHEQTFGDAAVVSFLYSLGDADPVVQNIIDSAPAVGETVSEGIVLNAADFAPDDLGYYKYQGSYTTPPCTEPVDWFVMLEQRTVSQEQVDALMVLNDGANNRPVQPLNGRKIITSGSRN